MPMLESMYRKNQNATRRNKIELPKAVLVVIARDGGKGEI